MFAKVNVTREPVVFFWSARLDGAFVFFERRLPDQRFLCIRMTRRYRSGF
jgi:hypothetical protein